MIALKLYILFSLTVAFAGAFYTERLKKFLYPTFIYYAYSLTGHVFALPLLLVSLWIFIAVITGADRFPFIALISAATIILYSITLWRAYRGTQSLNSILPGDNNPRLSDFIFCGLWPFKIFKSGVKRLPNIAYGDAGVKNLLDIYIPENKPAAPLPVMIHIHGGAWTVGRKRQQGQPIIQHMVSKGWIAVDINYRLGPKHRFPVLFEDVMRAIAWVKTNIADYGGDPDFVVLTGGSAGGHLTSLAALMPNEAQFKSGFEDIDCSVQAAIPVYGVYDFIDRTGTLQKFGQKNVEKFLTEKTMPGPRSTHEDFWDLVSPLNHLRKDAPHFLVIHGKQDALAPFKGAEIFVKALSEASENEVIFAPHPGGQHAYDALGAPPTPAHVRLIERFLTCIYDRRE